MSNLCHALHLILLYNVLTVENAHHAWVFYPTLEVMTFFLNSLLDGVFFTSDVAKSTSRHTEEAEGYGNIWFKAPSES